MAKDEVVAEVAGLQLSNNTFSASPPGSLLRAEECVMPQKGVIEPRRGMTYSIALASSTTLGFGMAGFDDTAIVNSSTTKAGSSYALGYLDGITLTPYAGTFNPVDTDGSTETAGRMRFCPAGEFLHFCTTTGPKALESAAGTPRDSGLLRMPDILAFFASAASTPIGSGEGLAYGESRAYRSVLRKPLGNDTSLLSPPSGRVVVTNRLLAPAGAMVRTGGNLVTVTFPVNTAVQLGVDIGDSFTLDPGEADFAAGTYTVTNVTSNVITYTDAGANVSNTVAQDFDVGPRPVILDAFLSADASTSTPVRLYRSVDTTTTSPSDEMFLVAETKPSGAEVTAGFMVFTDVTPESVINDPLYTNPQTGEGALQSNDRAPIYRDVAQWGSSVFYSNTTALQEFRLQMLGVGSPDGVQNNDTITIDGEVFTFRSAAGAAPEVQITSTGTPSYNIQQTTQALITAIAVHFQAQGVDIRAYYDSAQDEAPGKVLLQATTYSQGAFAVRASRPESWTPALAAASDTNSAAERTPNGLAWSKAGQPEAVPIVNYTQIGSKNFPIARILGLRQALLVFKQGDGIFALTGSAPFNVEQISTANIIAKDAACTFADAAWVYTDQGFLRVSDSGGATVVSRPIETELNRLRAEAPADTYNWSFVVPHEQERRVLLFVPFGEDTSGGRPILRAWCYNNATQAWTGPLYEDVTGGVVTASSAAIQMPRLLLSMYVDALSSSYVAVERMDDTPVYKNYVDGGFATSITEVTTDAQGNDLLKLATVTGVEDADLLFQAGVPVAAIRLVTGLYVQPLVNGYAWQTGVCGILKHYDVTVQFQPQGAPTSRKTLTRLAWLFQPEWFAAPYAETLVRTDQIQADLEIESGFGGFGNNGFGTAPFGDPSPLVVDVNPIAPKWVNAAQFFVGLTTPVAYTKLKLQGFSLHLDTATAPAARGK